ncbi:MAG: hypothetical protein C0469_15435 [Cyanobacteria bacterium DS2.3.42]|nr:hypothetical protein [Cyanobacteria bacterium DS2.3.42]
MPDEIEISTEQRSLAETKGELLAKLQAQLEPEEIVLWAEPVVPDSKNAMLIRVVAIAASAILLLLTSAVFIGDSRPSTVSIVVEIIFAFFAFRFARDFFDRQNYSLRNRVAVLTNMRALEVDTHDCSTLVWYSSPHFGHVEAVQTKLGLGNLIFATDEESHRFGFMNVPNTAEAAEILFRAQAKKETESRTNYRP